MVEIRPDSSDAPVNPQEVPFDSGCVGCLFLPIVAIAAVFAIAAFDSAFVASVADRETRRNIFAAIAPLSIGSINIGALTLAVVLGWEGIRFGRRFINGKAVWIDGDFIRFHPTVRRRPLALQALERITHDAGDIKSILVLQHSGGARIKIHAVEHDAAAAFVAQAQKAKAALTFG